MRELGVDPVAGAAPLRYPFEAVPAPGEAIPVAPGVLWLRMRLPMAGLNHINVWALEDTGGWTLADTGMQTPDTATAWQNASIGPLRRQRVQRVICTHMHPDHVGMAGWLTRHHDCRLWMTRLEYITCRMLVADSGREAPVDGVRFYRAAG
ncbi:MAG: MBL fold metallo-hydrolase, partial [Gammaproteobacteria bacterium]|nr:MBL fold metallo-hydrolase [Gammaproteobacteria bacterium]